MDLIANMSYKKLLMILSLITVLSYYIPVPLLFLPVYIALSLAAILSKKDALRVVTPLFFLLFSESVAHSVRLYTIYLSVFTPLLAIDFFKVRKFQRLGTFGVVLILLVDAAILSGFNAPSFYQGLEGAFIFLIVLSVYVYFVNALEYDAFLFKRVALLFMSLALVVSTQLFINFFTHELGPSLAFFDRQIRLGYLPTSTALIVSFIAIPLTGYLLATEKRTWPYILVLLYAYSALFIVLNRALMITALFYILLIAPYVLFKSDKRTKIIKESVIILSSAALGVFLVNLQIPFVFEIMRTINLRDLTFFYETIDYFVEGFIYVRNSFILGEGSLLAFEHYLAEAGVSETLLPSTFIQAQALGILGVVAFLVLQVKKVKLLLKTERTQRYFMVVLIVVTLLIGGIFSPIYFTVFYLVYLFLVLSALEVKAYENKQ